MRFWLSALLSVMLVNFAVAAEPLSLAELQAGEQIEVNFSTTGCFHVYAAKFLFTHDKVTVFDLPRTWDKERKQYIYAKPELIGSMELNDEMRQRLDRLFLLYTIETHGGCSTTDSITMNLITGGAIVESYEYTDSSCAASRVDDVLPLNTLLYDIRKQSKK